MRPYLFARAGNLFLAALLTALVVSVISPLTFEVRAQTSNSTSDLPGFTVVFTHTIASRGSEDKRLHGIYVRYQRSDCMAKEVKFSSGVLPGYAFKEVQPAYPGEARESDVSGNVQVQILISEQGKVIEAVPIGGHRLLRSAALEAARQWVFKPTEVSGVPVKVQDTLTFNFTPN